MELRTYQDPRVLRKPYFGVLELEDDDLGDLAYCFGVQSVFGMDGKVLVVDWREAPVSRLYYEYDSGEEFEEDIRGRERAGVIVSKRKVDTTDSKLKSIIDGDTHLIRTKDGEWKNIDKGTTTVLKEERGDHRLPEITALISNNQFQAITQSHTKIFLLQGGAGSGKTTVGLHRVSYLVYNNPQDFQPKNILVVVFNKSLQKYISGVLPSLNIQGNVNTETYHRWAGSLIRMGGTSVIYNKENTPKEILKFKKSAIVLKLVDRYIENLIEKSKSWFLEKLNESRDSKYEGVKEDFLSISKFDDLLSYLERTKADLTNHNREKYRLSLIKRLTNHKEDLYRLLSDKELIADIIARYGFGNDKVTDPLIRWQWNLKSKGQIDFADTGILLYLMQKKGVSSLPLYSHIMIDEAQDLSEVELATIILAADDKKSITICGDMAQKIKGDVSFDNPKGFEGFIRDLNKDSDIEVSAEKFEVGYRASKPIMNLAWHVLNEKPLMDIPRDGKKVVQLKTENDRDSAQKIAKIVKEYSKENEGSLLCIITRFRNEADQIFQSLKGLGVQNIRRNDRENFSFKPGIIVTNAHQIKGLEFSAVIIVNPSEKSYRDDLENRMLLHVAITRASEDLWIVGREPFAYGIEKYLKEIK
jgi:DNA helicase-2/ATP-dependent DNA helicase PcrA